MVILYEAKIKPKILYVTELHYITKYILYCYKLILTYRAIDSGYNYNRGSNTYSGMDFPSELKIRSFKLKSCTLLVYIVTSFGKMA